MSGLGSCPVCFLDLRPGIPLNVHLDTHPKEMIVKALMSALNTAPLQCGQTPAFSTAPIATNAYVSPSIAASAQLTTTDNRPLSIEPQQQQLSQTEQANTNAYYYQPQPLPVIVTQAKHFYELRYVQPEAGSYVEEGSESAQLLVDKEQGTESQSGATAIVQTKETEANTSENFKTEEISVNAAIAGSNDQNPTKSHPSTGNAKSSAAKILSVAVLDPKDNITWQEENRLSPNAMLPVIHPKKCVPVPLVEPKLEIIAGQLQRVTSPVKIRPVATSVIRSTPDISKMVENTEIKSQSEAAPSMIADTEKSSEGITTIDLLEEEESSAAKQMPKVEAGCSKSVDNHPPSTSIATNVQPRWPAKSKAPKVLKVTFKKPVHVESVDDGPQPSTSWQASEPASSATAISGVVKQEVREPEEDHDEVNLGMLQLKAESCEEVYISQQSLIKMEEAVMEEELDPYGYPGQDALNESKGSTEEDLLMAMPGTSLNHQMYVDMKPNIDHERSSLIEELLSESSVSSLVNGVPERISVDIRAEEVMPAKGEISEQESNADSELLWPSNVVEAFETSRILPSYETSVARESWNFGQATSCDNLTFNGIPKLSLMELRDGQLIKVESYQEDEAIAGPSDAVDILSRLQSTSSSSSSQGCSGPSSSAEPSSFQMANTASSSSKTSTGDRKLRPYSCPGCPESFRLFRQRKDHIITHHEELLSKKQRYNYMRQTVRFELQDDQDGAPATMNHFGTASEPHSRRIEQLSVIKLHRFLIEYNLKALKETSLGQRDELQGLLLEFSQRRMYFCTDCRQQFTTMREYRKHMVLHPVKCYTCEKQAEDEQVVVLSGGGEGTSGAAASRLKREDGDEDDVIIIEEQPTEEQVEPTSATTDQGDQPADLVFWNWRRFVEHQKMHLGLKEVNTCKKCNKSFSSRRKLNLHSSSVHRRKAYHCTFCTKTFMHFSRLKEHKKRHHFNKSSVVTTTSGAGGSGGVGVRQKDYLCPCGEVFHSAAKFAWHKETHEKNPKGCMYCRERFVHKNSLSRHIRLTHPEKYSNYKKDTLPCPVCNMQFIRTSLKTHIASHMKRAEFQCSICSKVLSTKWNLKIHRWTHNSRSQMPFKCTICSKAFMRANDLQTHINTHKAIRPFTCDYCGCQFSRKYNWVRHTREHETDKKFSCNQCGKTFHRAYYLKEHARSHTNERPFECTICGKTSTTKTNHNKHLKIHHARDVTTTEG